MVIDGKICSVRDDDLALENDESKNRRGHCNPQRSTERVRAIFSGVLSGNAMGVEKIGTDCLVRLLPACVVYLISSSLTSTRLPSFKQSDGVDTIFAKIPSIVIPGCTGVHSLCSYSNHSQDTGCTIMDDIMTKRMICFPLRRKSRFHLFSRNGLNAQRVRATNKRRACATRETRTQTTQGIHNSMYYTLDL